MVPNISRGKVKAILNMITTLSNFLLLRHRDEIMTLIVQVALYSKSLSFCQLHWSIISIIINSHLPVAYSIMGHFKQARLLRSKIFRLFFEERSIILVHYERWTQHVQITRILKRGKTRLAVENNYEWETDLSLKMGISKFWMRLA